MENLHQHEAFQLLQSHRIMEILSDFQPIVTGTFPLGINIETSDIDIICCSSDLGAFSKMLHHCFGHYPSFQAAEKRIANHQTVVGQFKLETFTVEIFAQDRPSKQQESYIHMENERRILAARGPAFREEIIKLKRSGMKTEPAFAYLLGLKGDPYELMLHINDESTGS